MAENDAQFKKILDEIRVIKKRINENAPDMEKEKTEFQKDVEELKTSMNSVEELLVNLAGEVHHLATIISTQTPSEEANIMVDAFRGRGS